MIQSINDFLKENPDFNDQIQNLLTEEEYHNNMSFGVFTAIRARLYPNKKVCYVVVADNVDLAKPVKLSKEYKDRSILISVTNQKVYLISS